MGEPTPLFEVPRRSWIRLADTGEQFWFERLDGMYSECRNDNGELVHLAAWTPVRVLDGLPASPTPNQGT